MKLLMLFIYVAKTAQAHTHHGVPTIDVSPLLSNSPADDEHRKQVIADIGDACRRCGFFQVVNHGVDEELAHQLETASRQFFALPRPVKRQIEMSCSGKAWRGYFEVGEELTSGVVDEKEGLYFARQQPGDERPLHGANLYPAESDAPGLRSAVEEWMQELERLSAALLTAIASSVGLDAFAAAFEEPTTLFRCFHYPPHDEHWGSSSFGVGEHTDYGWLTLLRQDTSGGLQAKIMTPDGEEWVDVPPLPGAFVVNLGDALEYATGGLLVATPHRVKQRPGATSGRYSWPFFFDPSFDAPMLSCAHKLPAEMKLAAEARRRAARVRWDGQRIAELDVPTYGDYLISKVSKVFPQLAVRAQIHQIASHGDDIV